MTIKHAEASFLLSLSVGKMEKFMQRYGHHYPVLYVLNRGKPLDLSEYSDEKYSVISVDNEAQEGTDPKDYIYKTLVGFKMQTDEDEKNIQKVADAIARSHNPDVIGLIMPCLYAEYLEEDAKIPDTLNDEPEACTILHMCYWIRDDKDAWLTQSPFQSDGTHVSKEDLEWASEEENAVNFGVVATNFPWQMETEKLKAKLLNPWRKQ